ncbi:hypothetical protein [Sphingobacterium humi]|uniref:Uncharacterized protein n=1 Tax=Sphingobacterium humi TaxID=1796905 RepID=A0A6N8L319_9SPHI|nr:hypothetical protein [Sphingobacterium humi]MVZ64130.1 hypothetical protein [Sphingobacterium humi]
MEIHLNVIAILLILLSIIHIGFPSYFKWKTELQSLSLINRQIMQVHLFFLGLLLFLMGLLCFYQAEALIHSTLGQVICLGLGFFWSIRLLFQFFVYSSALWKGKRFETAMHILFSCIWLYFSIIFWLIGVQVL